MRRALIFLLLAAANSGAPIARADYLNGQELFEMCSSPLASGYVMGVYDLLASMGSTIPITEKICVPAKVGSHQMRDVTCRFLAQNPQSRHILASDLVIMSLMQAWPCRRSP